MADRFLCKYMIDFEEKVKNFKIIFNLFTYIFFYF